jgi:streptogramin lyase
LLSDIQHQSKRIHSRLVALCLLASVCTCSAAQRTNQDDPGGGKAQSAQISEYVREVFQDRDGMYWFGTNGDGVVRFDGESLTYLSLDEGFGGRAVRGIAQDQDGVLWFATDGGVSRLEAGEFTNYTVENGLTDNQVWSLMVDRSGTIWVGTHAGICYLDGKIFVPFPLPGMEIENPSSRFSPNVVFGMFEDQEGNLWFGTDGEGAHKYDGTSFTSYTVEDGLAGNIVRSIYGDRQGRIWIGTNGGGVSRLENGVIQNFTEEDGLNNNRIYEIIQDRAGNMWFSTLGAGASRYDGKTFTPFREDHTLKINGYPARGHVQEFFEDKDGILWIGCSGGLFRFDGNTFINVKRDGPWPESAEAAAPSDLMGKAVEDPELEPVSIDGWLSEVFELPPGFAPELPEGKESLLFAPGWRDPNTEDFWSYAFVMSINEPAPEMTRIDELLEMYYNGLMSAFSSNKYGDIGISPVQVDVVPIAANKYEAKMHLIDAFATFEPIDLRVLIETIADTDEHSLVRIQVSQQPKDHKIWRSLALAIESIDIEAVEEETETSP